MNVPTPDDVATAVIERLTAQAGFAAAMAGGISQPGGSKSGEDDQWPRCLVMAEDQDPFHVQSDGGYVQKFTVEITVWKSSDQDIDGSAMRRELDIALSSAAGDPANGVSVTNAVKTLSISPKGGPPTISLLLQNDPDCLVAAKKIEVMIQGKR